MNLATWLAHERESSLVLAGELLDQNYGIGDLDTLFLYSSLSMEDDLDGDEVGDFRASDQRDLFARLARSTGAHVQYRDISTDDAFHELEVRFWAWIDRDVPFFVNVTSAESVSGFGCTYQQYWIWLFGWRPIGESVTSTS